MKSSEQATDFSDSGLGGPRVLDGASDNFAYQVPCQVGKSLRAWAFYTLLFTSGNLFG